jgi:hypothetical protein
MRGGGNTFSLMILGVIIFWAVVYFLSRYPRSLSMDTDDGWHLCVVGNYYCRTQCLG